MKPSNPLVLAINGGSSSIKFALFDAGDSLRRILEGVVEWIGLPDATLRLKGLNKADNFSRLVILLHSRRLIILFKRSINYAQTRTYPDPGTGCEIDC
ncbi:MAG: hypothetical protein HIU83_04705 [Proteobacteria bacterium]|nr:hypothetical protein [Pseudomonadota bacterium]